MYYIEEMYVMFGIFGASCMYTVFVHVIGNVVPGPLQHSGPLYLHCCLTCNFVVGKISVDVVKDSTQTMPTR